MSKENKRRNAEIFKERKKGVSLRKIGRMYNRHHTTINEICKRYENKLLSVDNPNA